MAVFRVEKNSGYTVMSNHHLRNRALSLKAKGLLSQMLSLPEDWDYTLQGLARINRESIDAIRQAIRELEQAGYIQRSRERDEKGRLRGADYVIFELPQPVLASVSPTLENPTLENPTQENPTLENPMQLNTQHFRRSGHCRGHLGLHGLYCAALLLSVQDRQHQQIRVWCPLRKERLNGVCDRSQRFDPCEIQSLIRADQAAAGLLWRCAFNGRTALFFGPELSFQQRGGSADDFCHAAGVAVRSVRAARPAP